MITSVSGWSSHTDKVVDSWWKDHHKVDIASHPTKLMENCFTEMMNVKIGKIFYNQ